MRPAHVTVFFPNCWQNSSSVFGDSGVTLFVTSGADATTFAWPMMH